MKPLIKRKYVAARYVNCERIDPDHNGSCLNNSKQSISKGADNSWHETEVFLEAPVLGYFIPTRDSDTRLEL